MNNHAYIDIIHKIPGYSQSTCKRDKKKIKKIMEEYQIAPYDEETHKGLIRHALIRKGFSNGELMVCLVINGKKLPHADIFVERLKEVPGMTGISYNINQEK